MAVCSTEQCFPLPTQQIRRLPSSYGFPPARPLHLRHQLQTSALYSLGFINPLASMALYAQQIVFYSQWVSLWRLYIQVSVFCIRITAAASPSWLLSTVLLQKWTCVYLCGASTKSPLAIYSSGRTGSRADQFLLFEKPTC